MPSGAFGRILKLAPPWAVLVALAVGCLLAFFWSIDRERTRTHDADQRAANTVEAELLQTFEGAIGSLRGLRGLREATPGLTQEQFNLASRAVLEQNELQGTQWVASVAKDSRAAFEAEVGRRIIVVGSTGPRPAPSAARWAPVVFVSPPEIHASALGIDHFSVPNRRAALLQADYTGRAQVTQPNPLPLAGSPQGVQIFLPVYTPSMGDGSDLRGRVLEGWVGGVFTADSISDSLEAVLPAGARYQLTNGDERIAGSYGDIGGGIARPVALPGLSWELRASGGAVFSWTVPLLTLSAALLALVLVAMLIWQSRRRELSMLVLLSERREREAAQAALRETEEKNLSIVTTAPDGIITTDSEGRITSMNPAAERMFGRSIADNLGRNISALLRLPNDRADAPGGVVGLVRRAANAEADADLIGLRDDATFPVEARVSRLTATGGLTLIARDVTQQRLAEGVERALRTVATAVAAGADPEAVFDLVAEQAGMLYEASGAYVLRCDGAVGDLCGRWGSFLIWDLDSFADVATVCRRANGRVTCADLNVLGEKELERWGVRSAIATPVRVQGETWGAVGVVSLASDAFAPGTESHLERFAELVSMAIANADARERLLTWAATDELTGLPNQRTFHEALAAEVERAQRHGSRLSLALFDVDHFKNVNDTHGHQVGDEVLVGIAERLSGIMRSADTVARVGGEEFGWIMVETEGVGAWNAADRARQVIESTPFGDVGPVTVSGGVCELSPTGSAGEIFRLADVALYWAKAHGRNVCFRYSTDAIQLQSAEERSAQMERIQRVGSIMGLARAVDAKDSSTQRHSERVAALAARIARELGWSEQNAALLHEASLVHDVGKIAVPDAVLVKPGPLSSMEYEQVKAHAELGGRIVEGCLSTQQAAWVRGHHERFDGLGYPDQLVGTNIPKGARILALADAWDAMTEVRLYRVALDEDQALRECLESSGSQFWPEAVDALVRLARRNALATDSDTEAPNGVAASRPPPFGERLGQPAGLLSDYVESRSSSDKT